MARIKEDRRMELLEPLPLVRPQVREFCKLPEVGEEVHRCRSEPHIHLSLVALVEVEVCT